MLENKQLRGIVPIVKDYQNQGGAGAGDEKPDDKNQKLEFDLYELTDQKCKELHNYVEQCLMVNEETKLKQEQESRMAV